MSYLFNQYVIRSTSSYLSSILTNTKAWNEISNGLHPHSVCRFSASGCKGHLKHISRMYGAPPVQVYSRPVYTNSNINMKPAHLYGKLDNGGHFHPDGDNEGVNVFSPLRTDASMLTIPGLHSHHTRIPLDNSIMNPNHVIPEEGEYAVIGSTNTAPKVLDATIENPLQVGDGEYAVQPTSNIVGMTATHSLSTDVQVHKPVMSTDRRAGSVNVEPVHDEDDEHTAAPLLDRDARLETSARLIHAPLTHKTDLKSQENESAVDNDGWRAESGNKVDMNHFHARRLSGNNKIVLLRNIPVVRHHGNVSEKLQRHVPLQ